MIPADYLCFQTAHRELKFSISCYRRMEKVIKNMVCPRCVESVTSVADKLQLPVDNVNIGTITFSRDLSADELQHLSDKLKDNGFELVSNRNEEIVSLIQAALIDYLDHLEKEKNPAKVSAFIVNRLPYNYSYISNLYSREKGVTIEQYLIKLKIERVKELLDYHKFTLSEIAWKLNYSSVQYLSNQFKGVTGITVTDYLKAKGRKRISLDQL